MTSLIRPFPAAREACPHQLAAVWAVDCDRDVTCEVDLVTF